MSKLFEELPEQAVPSSGARGAPRLIRSERRQVEMRAMSLDELLEPDHLARLVWAVVQRFDLTALLEEIEAREGKPGHAQTDPAILVALWLYATLEGVGSARELERLCKQHNAYRWLCGGVGVNYHSLSDFRVQHEAWLDGELTRGIASLLEGGAIDLDSVAQDGLRVRAGAGSGSFRRTERLEEFLAVARARVVALKAELPNEGKRSRKQAAAERAARERLERVEAALAAIPEAEARKRRNKGDVKKARVSTTDAEARIMHMPDGGFRPAYNVQFAAETKLAVVAGVEVTNSGGDADALDPMHAAVVERYQRSPAHWLADGGFLSLAGIEAVTQRGSALLTPDTSKMLAGSDHPAVLDWKARMASAAGQALYRLRARTIEWVNAGARNRGLYRVSVRGLRKVRAIALWQALAHNLSRALHNPAACPLVWQPA